MTREHYQAAFLPLLYGVGLAVVLTFFLRETGRAAAPSGWRSGRSHEGRHGDGHRRPRALARRGTASGRS